MHWPNYRRNCDGRRAEGGIENPKVQKIKIKMSLLMKNRKENVTKIIRQRAEDAAYELDEDSEMCLICLLIKSSRTKT